MSVIMSLMYAAGAVALLAVVLECCCRRRLRQLQRESPHIAALNGVNMNNVPYPVGTPYPVAATAPEGTVIYPMPVPALAVAHYDDDADCFFRPYPTPTNQTQNTAETPPPTYEQVMAKARKDLA